MNDHQRDSYSFLAMTGEMLTVSSFVSGKSGPAVVSVRAGSLTVSFCCFSDDLREMAKAFISSAVELDRRTRKEAA